MMLCDKLSEENIRCNIILSNDEESVTLYWNGEEFVGEDKIESDRLYNDFGNDELLMKNFRKLLETGVFEGESYRMEII